ncbi:MAG TPA: alpha/beta hydrolase [Acidimicrobiales bacterium]|nr:alpha/beta hydrolase [Acidimicrobiales bacterium]
MWPPLHSPPGRCGAGRPRFRTGLGLAAALASGATLLAACGHPGDRAASGRDAPAATSTTTTTTTPSTTTSTLPVTPITWSPCMGDLQCGTLTVPLDYADPSGPTIGIALARHPAEDPSARIGSLVINPGGPGVSGIDDFDNELSVLTPGLLDDFDIVTFDPRGVERSDPMSCGEGANAAPGPVPDPVPQTAAAQTTFIAGLRAYAAACEKASGALLPNIGTVDVAQDLERLRIALGDSALTYMGQSYGTLIGETYAAMYPTHVRAMVLDSPIDPALSFDQMTVGQAKGFEGELDAFFTWCAGTSACPWHTTSDPTAALEAQMAQSRTDPAPAGSGRSAGPGELFDALLDGLYATTEWPELGDALAADADGNGSPVVAMSNHYNQDGSTNGSDVAVAVDCADHPAMKNLSAYSYLAALYKAVAPIFGPPLAWGEAACAVWPSPPTRTPGPVAAPGAPPILVVGTTNDPATPYAWAVSVAHELQKGVLLTRDGNDHVSYFYSACVRSYVQSYFVSLTPPPSGTVCTS